MDRLRELLNTRLERLQDMLSGLTHRDRVLLLGLIGFLLFAVLAGGAYGLNRSLAGQASGRRSGSRRPARSRSASTRSPSPS